MTCKDCLHYDVCDALERYGELPKISASRCSHFKDKSHFMELPCRVGDVVYTNIGYRYSRSKDSPYKLEVVFIGLNNGQEMGFGLLNCKYLEDKHHNMIQFYFSDVGKTVFLSREEAEKALKEQVRRDD